MTISPILIEALARRAMQVVTHTEAPTVPVFRAAFEDELKRFDNSTTVTTTTTPTPAPAVRAKLVPEAGPSLGKGLGQSTGGTAQSDADEVRRILSMISHVSLGDVAECCGQKAYGFIADMRKASVAHLNAVVTGKQVFFARSIKDQLIEKGLV